jgi:[lysine-biosynthesis-protein LysW]---L-2-aminoadipate ligase
VSDGFRLGIFYTIVRPEEKALLAAAEARGVPVERYDDGVVTFGLDPPPGLPDVVLNRSVSHTRAAYAARCFAHYGTTTVNAPDVIELAGDKILSTFRLRERGIPVPRTEIALSPEAALPAIGRIGYPAVLKPAVGSWGRLMAKVDDPEEAEQILEHKSALGAPVHSVFYVQEYIAKPDRDLRLFVVGDSVVAGMYRKSSAWRTNAARGATAEPLPLTPELTELALRAARAMGGGVLAVDVLESDRGPLVLEVNPTPEFKTLQSTTDVDIAARIVDYAVEVGRR